MAKQASNTPKRYTIECTEEQLMLISKCVEDCCRFASGQTEMFHTTMNLDYAREIQEQLDLIQPLVTPHLSRGAYYNWAGRNCPNDKQRQFIAQCYPIYREILHFKALERGLENTCSSPTLTCAEGGEPVKVKEAKATDCNNEMAYLTGFERCKLKAQLWLEDELLNGTLIEGCKDLKELFKKFERDVKE